MKPSARVVHLSDVKRDDAPYVGLSTVELAGLSSEFSVAPSFVVTSNAFSDFLKHNNFTSKINHLLASIDHGLEDSVNRNLANIKKLILKGDIPDELVSEIVNHYERLGGNDVLIRHELSDIGGLLPVKKITGDAVVLNTIKNLWTIAFSAGNLIKKKGADSLEFPQTSIIIQRYPKNSMFIRIVPMSLYTHDQSKFTLEFETGHGYTIDKHDKKMQYHSNENIPTLYINRGQAISHFGELSFNFEKFLRTAYEVEKRLLVPHEIAVFYDNQNLQLAAIHPFNLDIPVKNNNNFLKGIPVSQGIATGHVQKLESTGKLDNVNGETVAVVKSLKPSDLSHFSHAKAIVIEEAEHLSNLYSEKPIVSGVPRVYSAFQNGDLITVNGTLGEIRRGGAYTYVGN